MKTACKNKFKSFLFDELTEKELNQDYAKYHILPIPLEKTVTFGKGTKKGPNAIIRASNELERLTEKSEPCKNGIFTYLPIKCSRPIEETLNEIEKVSLAFGGKKQTTLSLSGIGDIFLTCSSVSSRNYAFGYLIGKGKSKNDIIKKNSTVTEGLENAKSLYLIKKKYNLDTPILDSIYKILVKDYSVKKIVNLLLARPLKKE